MLALRCNNQMTIKFLLVSRSITTPDFVFNKKKYRIEGITDSEAVLRILI
jgi:hypothetical protein